MISVVSALVKRVMRLTTLELTDLFLFAIQDLDPSVVEYVDLIIELLCIHLFVNVNNDLILSSTLVLSECSIH